MAKSGMAQSDVESEDGSQKQQATSNDSADDNAVEPPETSEDSDGTAESNQIRTVAKSTPSTSTPVSIFIQSLIMNLCSIYEPDEEAANKLYQRFCNRLLSMNIIDESYSMVEFEGLRNQYQRAFHQLLMKARGGDKAVPLQSMWPSNDITSEWSHYQREFEEISYIAGGGFGQVFLVKHKLDGAQYAVKKIFIRSEGIQSVRSYLSEVKTFASLNHSNIVQYKAAWLEVGASTSKNCLMDGVEDEEEESSTWSEEDEEEHGVDTGYIYPETVTFDSMDKEESSDGFQVNFEESHRYSYSNREHRIVKRTKRSSISEGGDAICSIEEIKRLRNKSHHPKWATLFIQMSLCQMTLKQWLETRNNETNNLALIPVGDKKRANTVMEILRQLLTGIEYIHSKGIVHHDIKPSNIFIQLDGNAQLVQLGDFGLACPLQSTHHSLAFGTQLYAAPEQLAGKCDRKSDMYSLGIVIFELIETFRTEMERVRNISELRKGQLPASVLRNQPELAEVIGGLMNRQPVERPDAAALLKTLAEESAQVRLLQAQLAEKEAEIGKLRALLERANIKDVQT